MGRWQPDARGRLGKAALELYAERGFEQATVAEIADRAGLTARTFFRHFADKREVLFAGSELLADRLVTVVAQAPPDEAPLAVVARALDEVATVIGDDREHSSLRQKVIAANPDLQERELIKLASWSRVLGEGLRRRGITEPAASLAAEAGVAVFRVAFEHWLTGPAEVTLASALAGTFAELHSITGQPQVGAPAGAAARAGR